MAAATKLFLVLVAFACCMHLGEMARLRRDAPETNVIDNVYNIVQEATKDFTGAVETSEVVKQLKQKINDISADDVKKAFENASKATMENMEKLQNIFNNIAEAVAKEIKHEEKH